VTAPVNDAAAAKQKRRVDHIEQRHVCEREGERHCRQHERGGITGRAAKQPRPEPTGNGHQNDAGRRTGQSEGEFRLPEQAHTGHLQPVEQHGFIDIRRAIEQRDEPTAGPHHLSRQLSVMRFVRIEQARIAKPAEHHDPAGHSTPGIHASSRRLSRARRSEILRTGFAARYLRTRTAAATAAVIHPRPPAS
jgi:hypothetical protein